MPTDQVTLRVASAFHDKSRKVRAYRERNTISPDDQVMIAISVRDIPHGFFDADTYGLGAVYGLGPQYVTLDRDTGGVVDQGYSHRTALQRTSGTEVDSAPFLHPGHAHVTAVLVSGTDAANCEPPSAAIS